MFDERPNLAVRHLAAIVESSEDAIVSKDLNGIIKSWNRAAERMFGYTEAEAIGKSIYIIIPPDRYDEETDVLRRIRSGASVDHFETIRRRKDGTLFPIALSVSPIRDADGSIIGASKIVRDISERRRVEQALAEAEARRADLHRRLAALVDASASLLGSPRIEDVLPAILRLAGDVVAADAYAVWRFDAVRKAWQIASHVGVSDAFAAVVVTSHEAREASPVALTQPLAAGDVERTALLRERVEAYRAEGIRSMLAIPLPSTGSATATLVFYYRNLHEFTDVEIESAKALGNIAGAALQTADLYSNQRLREDQALFLARAAAILARSLDYKESLKSLAQLAVSQIADWCSVDMIARGVIDRLAIAHRDPVQVEKAERFRQKYPPRVDDTAGLAEVLRSGRPLMVEELTDEMIQASAKDAEHVAAIRSLGITSLMMVPLRTRLGTVGAITFVSSESGRRFTDLDLRFAESVADRAAVAIENAWSYEEARMANQLKDEFLATLSHELRTPLNAMLGYTRMLRAAIIPADKRDGALEVIERNGKLLAQIVDEVLDVSRIISGKLRLNIRPVEPARLLADALAVVTPAAEAKSIELRSAIATEPIILQGDADRLQQVLWNLLTNAVKFTPPGGQVSVGIVATTSEIEITVTDTGRGIDPAFLPHIFERFRQGDSGFTREHGGLGLGLSIARHIVEMHGGTISAESKGEGLGSTFRVRLPAVASEQRLSRLG